MSDETAHPDANRKPDGTFGAGNRANPGGRPKVAAEFRLKARIQVDELVLDAWVSEIKDRGEDWIRASELLTAYAYGRPKDSIELSQDPDSPINALVGLQPEDLAAFAVWRIEQLRSKKAP